MVILPIECDPSQTRAQYCYGNDTGERAGDFKEMLNSSHRLRPYCLDSKRERLQAL